MSRKATTVRVKPYTKELLLKHSKAKKMTQNDLIEKAILIAEIFDFEYDSALNEILKNQKKQMNRAIGFIINQEKIIKAEIEQTEKNIYVFFKERLREDRRQVLEYLSIKTVEEFTRISDEYYGENTEVKELFLQRFMEFFNETYEVLLGDINTIK